MSGKEAGPRPRARLGVSRASPGFRPAVAVGARSHDVVLRGFRVAPSGRPLPALRRPGESAGQGGGAGGAAVPGQARDGYLRLGDRQALAGAC